MSDTNNITINLTLSDEDRATLKNIESYLGQLCTGNVETAVEVYSPQIIEPASKQSKSENKEPTLDDLKAVFKQYAADNSQDIAVAELQSLGYETISAVPKEKYAELIEHIKKK